MRYAAGSMVAVLFCVTPAWAQFFPVPPGVFAPKHGKHAVAYGWPNAPYWRVYGYPAFGNPVIRVRVIVFAPPLVVLTPGTAPELPPLGDPLPIRTEKEAVPFDPEGVLAIRPRPGGVQNLPPLREAAPQPARKMPALPDPRPFEPPPLRGPVPANDPDAENSRQNQLGRETFAEGEYGRAADRFEQAIRAAPQKPESHFLLGQAQFALGKFRDATVAILAGLKIRPDWPAAKFDIRALYGENVAEWALHLERLRAAVDRNPDEPALLFLYGYQLWFNGRRDEAKLYFRKAAPLVIDPKPIEGFLAEPNGKADVR